MTIRLVRLLNILSIIALIVALSPAAPAADYSHARIVRLSQVQGEVKVARTDSSEGSSGQNLNWEEAVVNLPIREGYVLATGNGRAVIEFEHGAMAYLADNSVLQFTGLSLSDGARLTELTLTQGTATFYANPSSEDSFGVRSPSVEVKLARKGRFRLDTYDDGSVVDVQQGEVDVTSGAEGAETNHVTKGQSLSFRAGGQNDVTIGRLPDEDDWDHWVSDHEDSILSATNYASTYVNSPDYSAGLSDLYTYGSWLSYSDYGYCWRPSGVGYGWSPFFNGQWAFVPGIGWTWVSFEPWGWMPYHFGGWVFSPVYGWLWVPGGFGFGGFRNWRPATAVFVRGSNGLVGWVPVHPHDARRGAPANLAQGVITRAAGGGTVVRLPIEDIGKIKSVSAPPRGFTGAPLVSVAPPLLVSRSLAGDSGVPGAARGSSGIVFDPREHRFVNSNPAANSGFLTAPAARKNSGDAERKQSEVISSGNSAPGAPLVRSAPSANGPAAPSSRAPNAAIETHPSSSGASAAPRTTSAPPRSSSHPSSTPPAAPSRSSSPSHQSSSGGSSHPSSSAPRSSGGSSSSSGGGSSRSSGSGSGGSSRSSGSSSGGSSRPHR